MGGCEILLASSVLSEGDRICLDECSLVGRRAVKETLFYVGFSGGGG